MNSDWSEHILLRALCHKDLIKVNQRVLAEIKEYHFSIPEYKEAFRRIQALYIKKGHILTWKELMADASLSSETHRILRAKEIKRKKLSKHDASLNLPSEYKEYGAFVEALTIGSKLASLISLQNKLTTMLSSPEKVSPDKIDSIIKFVDSKMNSLSQLTSSAGNLVKLNKSTVRSRLKEFHKKLKNNYFLPTGFTAFDNMNLGIPLDSYMLIAGKTGSGKSTLALCLAANWKKAGARVCFVPLEMSVEQNLLRLGSMLSGIKITDIVSNLKAYYKPLMKKLDIFLEEKPDDPSCLHFYEPDVDETVIDILNTLKLGQYDVIIIDYIGLTAPLDDNEAKDLGMASRFAKVYATNNKTAIVYLQQLDDDKNRVRYARKLAEDASNAWYWYQTKDDIAELGYIQIDQKKARNQNPFPFRLKADLSCCSFTNYDGEDDGVLETQRSRKGNTLSKKLDTSEDMPDYNAI